MHGMPMTVNSTVRTSPFFPEGLSPGADAPRRRTNRERSWHKTRGLLGVFVVPEADRVFGWVGHVNSPSKGAASSREDHECHGATSREIVIKNPCRAPEHRIGIVGDSPSGWRGEAGDSDERHWSETAAPTSPARMASGRSSHRYAARRSDDQCQSAAGFGGSFLGKCSAICLRRERICS